MNCEDVCNVRNAKRMMLSKDDLQISKRRQKRMYVAKDVSAFISNMIYMSLT